MKNNNFFTKEFIQTLIKTILVSVIVNLIILVIARSISSAPLTFGPFMYGPVILFTVLGVISASLVYILIKKYIQNPNPIFKIVSGVALFLSFIPDLQLLSSHDADNVGATPIVVGILILMHIVTALIVIFNFTKTGATRRIVLF